MFRSKDIEYDWKEVTSFVGAAGILTMFIYTVVF